MRLRGTKLPLRCLPAIETAGREEPQACQEREPLLGPDALLARAPQALASALGQDLFQGLKLPACPGAKNLWAPLGAPQVLHARRRTSVKRSLGMNPFVCPFLDIGGNIPLSTNQ